MKSKMPVPPRKAPRAKRKQLLRPGRGGAVPKVAAKGKAVVARAKQSAHAPHAKTATTRFTIPVNPTLTLACVPAQTLPLFTLGAAAALTGVHPEMLRYYWRAGLVDALGSRSENELLFEESALHEIRRTEHYRRHLDVGRRALPLICELRREAERRQIEIRFLEFP